ncbi:MATE family efflux transporter [Dasania sp. GY-MA-18]|uniref:Multidrug export protein MepA n=1 Tax=Dasania phycosphaerae TaxID=2950436 RepID=A0A9J6RMP7_9GAMM|nr:MULTISPECIES: MATE family efflux transporter [Dasania]MCR8923161.1 MATE family efflux transporter [Dasania sp. GY-MA-18]MCZ0865593.1 MATE family efflux transporter [Dasania phycosphaerae]MCZ0869318.1 MATE family efflux transporter [Dasania phycosphaerae]
MTDKYDPITGKPSAVFFRYAIPSVLGLLSISSAQMIDAMFVGNYVGKEALAAINLTIPASTLIYAIVFMLAVGGSVVAGKFLGENNPQAASDSFTKIILTVLLLSLMLCLPGMIFINPVAKALGATAEILPLVDTYLFLQLLFTPMIMVGAALSYFVVADGRPLLSSSAFMISAALNVLLDWLFIVVMDKGLAGAALATGLSGCIIIFILLPHPFSKAAKLRFVKLQGSWMPVLKAAINGISEFTNEVSVGIVTLLFNWIIITQLGTEGIAAFTVIIYVLYLGVMISYGFSEALQPTISKNLGAKNYGNIRKYLNIAISSSIIVGAVFCLVLLLSPDPIIALFLQADETQTIAIAKTFIGYFWPTFLFVGANIAFTSYFTAIHQPTPSAILALARSLILPVIFLFTLPLWLGNKGIYLAIPLAEAITCLLAIALLSRCKYARHQHQPVEL